MSSDELTRRLLDEAGTTYAEQAGITLADKPMPLFELLVLCMLASKPIDATIAETARPRPPRTTSARRRRCPAAARSGHR